MKTPTIKILIFIVFLFSLAKISVAQNPKRIKYKGYYKNIPVFDIHSLDYKYYGKYGNYVEDIISKDSLTLYLKGFDKGDDVTIVFSCSEPVIGTYTEKVDRLNKDVAPEYYGVITAEASSRVLFLDKDGEPFYSLVAEPDRRKFEYKGFSKSSPSEAEEQLQGMFNFRAALVKKGYVKQLVDAYQRELDDLLGKFAKENEFYIHTIDSKKFDYTEFNEASNDFIQATSSPNIDTDENREIILNSIDVWKKNLEEYSPGKKTRICDRNFDQIQFNITMGYLALGDGDKYSEFWQKCLDTRGMHTAETHARRYMPTLVANYKASVENKGKGLESELISENDKMESMIIVKGFVNSYLSTMFGNLFYVNDYFPANSDFVLSGKTAINSFDDETGNVTENLQYNYASFGKLGSLNYTTSGHPKGDKKYKLTFEYDRDTDKLSEITSNGKTLFTFKYGGDNGELSHIVYPRPNNETFVFRIDKVDEENIRFENIRVSGGETKLVTYNNWIEHTKDYKVTRLLLNGNGMFNIKRDSAGSIVEFQAVDPADNSITIPLEIETDYMGNAIKTKSRFSETESEFLYMY